MTDLPILFTGMMVNAILREIEHPGTGKTQTRRFLRKFEPKPDSAAKLPDSLHVLRDGRDIPQGLFAIPGVAGTFIPPRGAAGDRLYVREAWRADAQVDKIKPTDLSKGEPIRYEAGGAIRATGCSMISPGRLRASMHMPRWASRLTLHITEVRIEPLQHCTDADALAEGVMWSDRWRGFIVPGCEHPNPDFPVLSRPTPREMYAALWDVINGPGAWSKNPMVAVYTFRPVLNNIEKLERVA